MINPQIWQDVPHEEVRKSKVLSYPIEDAGGDQEPDIAECDEFCIFRLKQRTRWVEVVDAIAEAILLPFSAPFALSLVEVMPGHIRDQVGGPATKLLVDKVEGSREGCLFGKLVELMQKVAISRSIIFSGLRHEDHISLHVARRLVMLAMRDLPREVWHQQSRVADEADGIVENLAGRERLVSAFVSHDPQPSAKKALHKSVADPETSSCCR